MSRTLAVALVLVFSVPSVVFAKEAPITRRDGFLLIWQSIHRPAEKTNEKPFLDVPKGSAGFDEITFAQSRGLLGDSKSFHPASSLDRSTALLWLLRTRNVDDLKTITPKTIPTLLKGIGAGNLVPSTKKSSRLFGGHSIARTDLLNLINAFDSALAKQVHEISFYSEDFQGQGTAFGEKFDMHALTAAHRTFPGNTLVKIRNVANGKSVLARINDRGPYVAGRDMDLSLAAFTAIAERSQGKIHATFERLGDRSLVRPCVGVPIYQSRISKAVRLIKGIPRLLKLGDTVTLRSASSFLVLEVRNPDGTIDSPHDWIAPGAAFGETPTAEGLYDFVLGAKDGSRVTMEMQVMDCGRTRQRIQMSVLCLFCVTSPPTPLLFLGYSFFGKRKCS